MGFSECDYIKQCKIQRIFSVCEKLYAFSNDFFANSEKTCNFATDSVSLNRTGGLFYW